ncbi:hypothetical protein KGF57_002208 [Candida theae]|uniref:Mto2p-binding domain-containing protein n=1 Tax=Candida theae TaxID=1198502 RepID=A0AAD5BFI2_9ASCO|nr:uncharacterized protein KGF57_002208 [Candida theae]KAI5959112.1 hypothetical protein KGF57_002208 [Candida theae]
MNQNDMVVNSMIPEGKQSNSSSRRVSRELDLELDLRSVSSTESVGHSPPTHDMSSPFIEDPLPTRKAKGSFSQGGLFENKDTSEGSNPTSSKSLSKPHSDAGLGKSSPVKNESFVDNSLEDASHLHQTPIKLSNNNVSPWRQFRPPSNLSMLQNSSTIFNNKPDLKYGLPNPNSAASEMSTKSEIKKLNDEIYNYQVKVKMMADFLRDLIAKGSFDTSEIRSIIADVDIKPVQLPSLQEKRIQELEADKKECLEIINELQINLESFESCANKQSAELDYLNSVHRQCLSLIKKFADYLRQDERLSNWRSSLDQQLATSLDEQVEHLVHIAQDAMIAMINKKDQVSQNISSPLTPPGTNYESDSTTNLIHEVEHLKMENKDISERYESTLNKLNDREQEVQELQRQLKIANASNMESKQLFESVDKEHNDKLMYLQSKIDQLENDTGEEGPQNALPSSKDTVSQTQYDSLMIQHQDLQNAYASLLEELNALRESSASRHTPVEEEKEEQHSANSETTYLSEQTNRESAVREDLNRAMKQQQLHEAEQAQMSFIVSTIRKENEELRSRVKKMTDLVTYTESSGKEEVLKRLSVMEFQFKDLLKFDLGEFQKLIQSFNKVAEDESLLNPIRRYERIKKALVVDLDESSTRTLRDNHKSMFEYFVRATDILINNYVRLLLAEDETQHAEVLKKQVTKLKEQNAILRRELEDLQRARSMSFEVESQPPNSQLRLTEMRRKWKAERERRIMEDKEAQKRYNELRNELSGAGFES